MNKRRWETAVLHAGGFADVRDATRSITQRLAALLVVLFMLGLLHAATAAEIDTPEAHQPYGSRAKQALSELVFGKDVRVVVATIDRYGRTVGRIYAGSIDISAEMVRQGAAWVYRKYNHDPSLLRLEQEAHDARRGLWRLPEAQRMPPWEWRKAKLGRDYE